MGFILFIVAAILFFLAGVGSPLVGPNPTTWGLFALAIGLAIGGWIPKWGQPRA